jgi:VanZ family protein
MGTWAPHRPGIWAPTLVSIGDVARNLLLYVAFGAFGALARQANRPWWREAIKVALIAVLFSSVNEALQLYTSDRVASLTDVTAAAIGAYAGAAAISIGRSRHS